MPTVSKDRMGWVIGDMDSVNEHVSTWPLKGTGEG